MVSKNVSIAVWWNTKILNLMLILHAHSNDEREGEQWIVVVVVVMVVAAVVLFIAIVVVGAQGRFGFKFIITNMILCTKYFIVLIHN